MNERSMPGNFMKALLAQDSQLNEALFDEQRRQILQRLASAEMKERKSRKVALIICGGLVLIFGGIIAVAAVSGASHNPEVFPEWMTLGLAVACLLCPIAAILICSIYLLRYRRDAVGLRREAYEQTMLALPKQVAELRKKVDALEAERIARKNDSQQGFTVVELLVVISILLILAALIFPALLGAKARARTTVCKNNVGQIGKGLLMDEADYNYFPGAGDAGIVQRGADEWAKPSTNSWVFKIRPYFAEHGAVFLCPEYNPPVVWRSITIDSFGYNAGGSAVIFKDMDLNLGLGYGHSNYVALSGLKAPADMVAAGDMQLPGSVWSNILTPNKVSIGGLLPVPSRHGGGANMVFVDGHVEWSKQANWTRESVGARARWNNDHEPHRETW